MRWLRSRVALLTTLLVLVSTVAVAAQVGTKHLSLRIASGGGGAVSAGGYTLVASIGQHDAGAQGAGGYVVAGGVLVAKPQATQQPPPPENKMYLPVVTK